MAPMGTGLACLLAAGLCPLVLLGKTTMFGLDLETTAGLPVIVAGCPIGVGGFALG